MTSSDPEPCAWDWTYPSTLHVLGSPAEVNSWPVITHMAGIEALGFEVRARQADREYRAPSARLLAARQRLWIHEFPEVPTYPPRYVGPGPGTGAAVQMQLDVLLMPGPDGYYMEYEVLPDSNPTHPTDRKEG